MKEEATKDSAVGIAAAFLIIGGLCLVTAAISGNVALSILGAAAWFLLGCEFIAAAIRESQ